jgi:hypothetical protein
MLLLPRKRLAVRVSSAGFPSYGRAILLRHLVLWDFFLVFGGVWEVDGSSCRENERCLLTG